MLLNILPWESRLKIRYNKCDQIRIDPDNIQAIHILYFTNTLHTKSVNFTLNI